MLSYRQTRKILLHESKTPRRCVLRIGMANIVRNIFFFFKGTRLKNVLYVFNDEWEMDCIDSGSQQPGFTQGADETADEQLAGSVVTVEVLLLSTVEVAVTVVLLGTSTVIVVVPATELYEILADSRSKQDQQIAHVVTVLVFVTVAFSFFPETV